MFVCVCVCVPVKRAVCICVPRCALFEFTFPNGRTFGHSVLCCLEFSRGCSSNFVMTGLLSVFSLLPVQALKKREDEQEEVEEEEDPGGPGIKQAGAAKLSSQDDGESSDKDAER